MLVFMLLVFSQLKLSLQISNLWPSILIKRAPIRETGLRRWSTIATRVSCVTCSGTRMVRRFASSTRTAPLLWAGSRAIGSGARSSRYPYRRWAFAFVALCVLVMVSVHDEFLLHQLLLKMYYYFSTTISITITSDNANRRYFILSLASIFNTYDRWRGHRTVKWSSLAPLLEKFTRFLRWASPTFVLTHRPYLRAHLVSPSWRELNGLIATDRCYCIPMIACS